MMFVSVIEQRIVPGGDCSDADPLLAALSTRAVTRCDPVETVSVMTAPDFATEPLPL